VSRVFVSYYKNQEVDIQTMQAFWDGFVNDLKDCGNEVLVINTAYFNSYTSNKVNDPILNKLIYEKVSEINPELIITFNNRVPLCILEKFDDVPIVIWDGDSPSFQCDWPYIIENKDKYTFFTISKEWKNIYIYIYGISPEKIHYIPVATSVRRADIVQDKNISFVGARAYYDQTIIEYLHDHRDLKAYKNIFEEFLETSNFNYEHYIEKHVPNSDLTAEQIHPLFDFRWLTLANMLDLGLTIYGHESRWEETAQYMPQLVACYDTTRVWTNKENENLFNSSKISLCPIHPQAAGDAFSWRVFDIMASNACLVVSESKQLRELTKDYVDLPMYKTPWEAREICKELLENDEKRMGIVKACQKYVDENARWILRFREMENILGVKLVNDGVPGTIKDLYLDDIAKMSNLTKEKKHAAPAFKKYNYTLYKRALIFSFLLIIVGSLLVPAIGNISALARHMMSFGVSLERVQMLGMFLCGAGILGFTLLFVNICCVLAWKIIKKISRYFSE